MLCSKCAIFLSQLPAILKSINSDVDQPPMSHPLSFPKIVHPISLILAGIVGSVLVSEAMPRAQTLQQVSPIAPVEEVREVNGAAVLGIAALGSAGLGMALTAMHERNRRLPVQPKTLKTGKANPKLQRQLLRLLHEDRQAAERLVNYATLKYPGHNADWYVEKVIYDLKRDRH
jgi:hypothetical protein